MKVIKDEDLLSLHHQIEKSETKQKQLEGLLDLEADRLKKSKKTNRLFGSFSVILLLLAVFLVANAFYSNKSSKAITNDNYFEGLAILQKRLETTQKELEELKKEKSKSKEIQNLYLYRSLISKDTVFSVQIKAVNDKKITSISEKYTNTLVYSDASLYKLSLGIFETLPEAQEFRRALIGSGILDKRIFVISYKDGKRLGIEDYQ